MKRIGLNPIVIALILAVILFAVGGIVQPGFASYGQAMNILRLAAFLGIVAAGQTLVIISGGEGIDLSVGAVITLGAILVFRIGDGQNDQALLALAIALGVGLLIGATNGLGITLLGIPPLVMTLGMTGVVQGLILVITGGRVEGGAAPALTGLVTNPLILGIPGVIFLWLLLGAADVGAPAAHRLRPEALRGGHQPRHREALRGAGAVGSGADVRPERDARRPRRGRPARLYRAGLPQSRRPLHLAFGGRRGRRGERSSPAAWAATSGRWPAPWS